MTVIAFDVNETLLDLRSLDSVLGGPRSAPAVCLDASGLVCRRPHWALYGLLHRAVCGAEDAGPRTGEVLAQMRLDIPTWIRRWSGSPISPWSALTNLPLEVATAQLEFVGIAGRFAAVLSADQVLALKARREAYQYAATALGDIRLLAAHGGTSPARWQRAAMQLSCDGPVWPSSRPAISLTSSERISWKPRERSPSPLDVKSHPLR